MAHLYLDNDVSLRLVAMLEGLGHRVVTARDLGLSAAGDEVHFSTAVQRNEVFVTCNRRDFAMLHRAWLLWPSAFQVTLPRHRGIIVIDQAGLDHQIGALNALLSDTAAERLANQMIWWHVPVGWLRLAGQTWTSMEPAE